MEALFISGIKSFYKNDIKVLCRSGRYAIMPLCRYAVMPLCRYAVTPLCRYAVTPLCRYAVMNITG